VEGFIYYLTFASKYSPINFIFGKSGGIDDPVIYDDNKISETKIDSSTGTTLINFDDRFYVMYIVLLLLIFLTVIIRLTTDTKIDCVNFKGPIFDGCNGYRIYMAVIVLLFINFSTDFIDSFDKISLDYDLVCPWRKEMNGYASPKDKQIYTARSGECRKPGNIVDTPLCMTHQIIECSQNNREKILPGCMMNRRSGTNLIKEVDDSLNKDKIIVKQKTDGSGYEIDADADTTIQLSTQCKNSINNWFDNNTLSDIDFKNRL
jgi:uncharacterized Tic20 family protein